MVHAGEDHRQPALVGGSDDLIVAAPAFSLLPPLPPRVSRTLLRRGGRTTYHHPA